MNKFHLEIAENKIEHIMDSRYAAPTDITDGSGRFADLSWRQGWYLHFSRRKGTGGDLSGWVSCREEWEIPCYFSRRVLVAVFGIRHCKW